MVQYANSARVEARKGCIVTGLSMGGCREGLTGCSAVGPGRDQCCTRVHTDLISGTSYIIDQKTSSTKNFKRGQVKTRVGEI